MATKKASVKKTGPKAVRVQLTGEDGNVFSVIGRVSLALKRAGYTDEATKFREQAFACKDYNEVLALCMDTVDVH